MRFKFCRVLWFCVWLPSHPFSCQGDAGLAADFPSMYMRMLTQECFAAKRVLAPIPGGEWGVMQLW